MQKKEKKKRISHCCVYHAFRNLEKKDIICSHFSGKNLQRPQCDSDRVRWYSHMAVCHVIELGHSRQRAKVMGNSLD